MCVKTIADTAFFLRAIVLLGQSLVTSDLRVVLIGSWMVISGYTFLISLIVHYFSSVDDVNMVKSTVRDSTAVPDHYVDDTLFGHSLES